MITCRFHGQLGNNLFQLAATLALKEMGKEVFFLNSVHRGNIEEIGDFEIHPKRLEIRDMFSYNFNFMNFDIFETFYKDKFELYNHPDLTHDGGFGFSELPIKIFTILNGYFQSEKYFNFFSEKLRDVYFRPSFSVTNEIDKKYNLNEFKNSISLHYRRGGDRHLGNMQEYFKDLDFEYYHSALDIITDKDKEAKKVFIFSDDINWCKENINKLVPKKLNLEVDFISGNKNYVDLFLMSFCKNNIVANSTFSWWSAWLNKNEKKIAVAPKTNWFGPKLKHMDLEDLFPSDWVGL